MLCLFDPPVRQFACFPLPSESQLLGFASDTQLVAEEMEETLNLFFFNFVVIYHTAELLYVRKLSSPLFSPECNV